MLFMLCFKSVAVEVTTAFFSFFFLATIVISNNSTSTRCTLPAEPVESGIRNTLKNKRLPWREDGYTLELRLAIVLYPPNLSGCLCSSIYWCLCDCWCRLWLLQSSFGPLSQLSGLWKPVSGKWEQCVYRSLKIIPQWKKKKKWARQLCCWWPKVSM